MEWIFAHHQFSSVKGVRCLTTGLLFKTWCPHYPQCNLATEWNHWRQFTRLYEAAIVLSDTLIHILMFPWSQNWSIASKGALDWDRDRLGLASSHANFSKCLCNTIHRLHNVQTVIYSNSADFVDGFASKLYSGVQNKTFSFKATMEKCGPGGGLIRACCGSA